MKFTLQSVTQCAGRLGTLSELERLPGFMMETPMLLLHTKGGVVPNLTFETLQMITKEHYPLSVSVESSLQCVHPTSKKQMSLAEFIGMKEHLVFCGIHNTGVPLPQGYNGKLQVSMWTKSGREVMDAERYMNTIESFQPDLYQTLCDGDTNPDCSKKRLQKAVESTYSFFRECMRRHQESKVLKNSTLLASLGGGYNVHVRGSSAKLLAKVPVKGFVIDGLCANGSVGESLNSEDISLLVQESLKHIPVESFRLAPGCWSPELVWHLVKLGVDAFDSSLPSVVAARGAALTFQFDPATGNFTYTSTDTASSKADSDGNENATENSDDKLPKEYEINLSDIKYREKLEPVMEGCRCLTCTNHSKAYIHHLLITQELLAPVLLMIHNLHHYMEFFKQIRQAIQKVADNEKANQ